MRKFLGCDVLAVLNEIMRHNTEYYQEDFEIDKEILSEAADENLKADKRFLWMSRKNGTHCLKEKELYLQDTPEYNTWLHYEKQIDDNIIAYAVEIDGCKNGVLTGDLYELDYLCSVEEIRNTAVPIEDVELFLENDEKVLIPYENDWDKNAACYDYYQRDFLPSNYKDYGAAVDNGRAKRLNARYAVWDLEKLRTEYRERGNAFSIYQLKSEEYRFSPYVSMRNKGYEPVVDDYEMIYTDKLNEATLNDIYERFNIDRPKDYVGYSLSVSDVIVLIKDGERTAYMVDSFGFKGLPDFFSGSGGMQMQCETEM